MTKENFYERRKDRLKVSSTRRNQTDRRTQATAVLDERRRLSNQVRRYDREPFKIPVDLKVQDQTLSGSTRDISPEGLLLFSDADLNPETLMTLHFVFGNACSLRVSGEVVFSSPARETSPHNAIGINFPKIRDWEKDILAFAVKELRQSETTQENSILEVLVGADDFSILKKKKPTLETKEHRAPCVHDSKIIGWGSFLPPQEINNEKITEMIKPWSNGYRNVGEVIGALTGIKSRRFAGSDTYPSDLASLAAQEALKASGLDPKDLDVIIFCGIARDFDEPATANVVQEKIGAKNAYVYDVVNACNGFVTAIDALDAMISGGRCETGIVVTGEKVSIAIDWEPKTKRDFKLSMFSYTVGDAGGAAVLSRKKPGESQGIRARWFSSEGSHWRLAIAGDLEGANAHDKFFRSEGIELEKVATEFLPNGFENIMRKLNWSMDDIGMVIPHQIPITLTENLFHKALGIPNNKLMWTFPKFGNVATASIPVAMCEALNTGKVKQGDQVLLAGVAAGFTVGLLGVVL